MIRRYGLFLLVLGAALVTAVAYRPAPSHGWPDPGDAGTLKFSHKTHVEGVTIACGDCHGADKSTMASDNLRANHDNCSSCHEDQLANDCGFCHVDPDNIQAAPMPLREIVFSHKQHVTMKNVECVTCHKGIETAAMGSAIHLPVMESCTSCHNDRAATNQCEACHTSFVKLVPPDHLEATFRKEHRQLTRLGGLETSCATCHTQSFCAECHDAAAVMRFGRGAMMSDPTPRVFPGNTAAPMTLLKAHDLNYRFTHGIDAKAKSSDCATCHSVQDFCVQCHEAGDNITSNAFMPAWHRGAGFTTIGVGTGGGRHAEFARRDIESCVACHDSRGSDPTCITCHMDPDGIRGTDPRTHPAGYMRGEHGIWHTSPGATCYNCHTDFNARPSGIKGRNFCGYCHG